jgi:DNA-binding MarR family transcriptional regulator
MSESCSRTANLVGALSLAITERLLDSESEGGLDRNQAAALVTLSNHPGHSIDSLSKTLGLTHSGAVRLVDRLQASALVLREPGGPGRTLALRLTGQGEAAALGVLGRRQAVIEQVLTGLDEQDVATLEGVVARLLAALTSDRQSAQRICRLCDEALCERHAACPVDEAVAAP